MKVSIIIPVYNVAPYITRCLVSVAKQTYKDLECILIDDCGTDNSMMLANSFIQAYQGNISFIIYRHPHNRGLSCARNTGIKKATGEFIYLLDSDDAITSDCIETLVGLFQKHPDIDFATGNTLNENMTISKYGIHHNIPEYITGNDITRYLLSLLPTNACNRLIRRSFITINSLYFPEGILHEDMHWMYFVAKNTHAVAFTRKGLYIYYTNEGSIMTSTSIDKIIKRYQSRLISANAYMDDITSSCHYSRYQYQYLALTLLSAVYELYHLHSWKHWRFFWKNVYAINRCDKYKWHIYNFLFYLCLFPPFCFFASRSSIRWRVQKTIVNHL